MAAYPSCIRAIPHDTNKGHDSPSIRMCLYMHTAGRGITDKLRKEAEEMFSDYNYDFVDLEIEPLGEYFTPRDRNDQLKSEKMAKLAQIIEKNLPLFENRLNVTAVYPSYKISEGQETDDLCITVSILGKGLIPVGENEFLETLDIYPLDIVEGYFWPTQGKFLSKATPLHLGVGIGVRGQPGAGTLGAILTDGDHLYALSCQHVLSKKNEKRAKEQPTREQPVEERSAEEPPDEERSAETNFVIGKERLEYYISKRKEHLKQVKEKISGDLTELEIGNITEKIRRLECEVRAPEQDEILIEQPAAEDFTFEKNKLEKNITKKRNELKEPENMHSVQNEWKKDEIEGKIQEINTDIKALEAKLKNLTHFALPRCIATYSCGLRQNYYHKISRRTFFVDAAIAKIGDDESNDILLLKSKRGSVYGFDKQKQIDENGTIVPFPQIEIEAENAKFWKDGRTTSHTEGGRLRCEHFYANLEGYNKNTCFGEFTNIKFKTYCEACAPEIECDLFETSLLEGLECAKCKENIPNESKKSELWAYNCFLVVRKRKPFSKEGDSGAVIFDEEGRAWGIIVGSFNRLHIRYTVAIPIDVAFEALGQKLGKELKLLCVNTA